MSRIQLIDFKYARPEVDVWAAAAVLYWLLTGSTPRSFPDGADPIAVVLQSRAVPVRARNSAVPPALAAVVDEALVDDPAIVTTSAAALRSALLAWLASARA